MTLPMLLRSIPTLAIIASTALMYGQGFPATPVEWSVPNGGFTLNEISHGFNYVSTPSSNLDNGTEFWEVVDMNGDKMPDLVSTGIRTTGILDAFASGTGPCWHVFMSNGSGFDAEPTLWSLPAGGKISTNELGFSKIRGSGGTEGSETWDLSDLNGDGRPDLIVTAQNTGGTFTGFSPDNGAYWKVYLNTGTGFSDVPMNWPLPMGGLIMNGNALGFTSAFNTNFTGSTLTTGSDLWNLTDMDGDGLQDLTIYSEFDQVLGQPIGFQPNAMSYWKVHLNTGSSFNNTYETWALPNGGGKFNGVDLGFNGPFRQNTSASLGSQNWNFVDINGDSKPDLVVTAERIAGGTDVVFSGNATSYWKVYLNTGSMSRTLRAHGHYLQVA